MSKYVRANWVCWRPTDRYPEVREDNGRRIAVVVAQGYLTSDRSEEAIAHLIAAAPELLEAVEYAFAVADEGMRLGPEWRERARAVIAKAKGD